MGGEIAVCRHAQVIDTQVDGGKADPVHGDGQCEVGGDVDDAGQQQSSNTVANTSGDKPTYPITGINDGE